MSNKQEFIESLNDALSWELAGIVQYLQHSVMVTGPQRIPYAEWFQDGSEEAHGHAEIVANRITALGGVPTVEPARIRQAADLNGMLEAALALEVDALAAWERAHEVANEAGMSKGYIFWLEEHVAEEQEHVDELRKMSSEVSFKSSQLPKSAAHAG